ncbi:MAG: peptidase MA family metallohydrolase [Armatimonadota bacterium]
MRHLLVLLLLVSCAHAEAVQWRVMRTEHFLVHYTAGREKTASTAGEVAEEWYPRLSDKLRTEPHEIIRIFLYPDRIAFGKATGARPEETIVGTAHIRLHSVKIDASGALADIRQVIPHELVHIFVSTRLGRNSSHLSAWMHEGLAKHLTDDWSAGDAELLADVASSGNLLPLDEISLAFPAAEGKRAVAYAQSCSAVKYMADTYSEESIQDLLTEMADGQPFRKAMLYSLGVEPEKFESDWRAYLIDKYSLARWTKLASALASAFMALVCVLAFRARRRAKREKAREFEEESPIL